MPLHFFPVKIWLDSMQKGLRPPFIDKILNASYIAFKLQCLIGQLLEEMWYASFRQISYFSHIKSCTRIITDGICVEREQIYFNITCVHCLCDYNNKFNLWVLQRSFGLQKGNISLPKVSSLFNCTYGTHNKNIMSLLGH